MPKSYRVEITPRAGKELDDLSAKDFSKIDKEIQSLSTNPRPFGVQKLDKELYRIRIGDYRIIYAVFEKEPKVIILRVVRRSEKTYKKL